MLKAWGMKDVGRCRDVNQDYIYVSEEPVGNLPNLFLVADGMGGHQGRRSRLGVHCLAGVRSS